MEADHARHCSHIGLAKQRTKHFLIKPPVTINLLNHSNFQPVMQING